MNRIHTLLAALLLSACSAPGPADETLVSFTSAEELYGFKDLKGEVVLPAKYVMSFTDTFSKKIAFVIDEKEGLIAIDRKGNYVLTPFMFDNGPDYFEEGLFRFIEKGKFGFADSNGNKVIPAQFDVAGIFSSGRAAFCEGCEEEIEGEYTFWRGGKWGFIDKTGKKVIPAQYDQVNDFENGFAYVELDSAGFDIDTLGNRAGN
ncbi:MAG: WG repeat-containing protein [Bacteroidota bacterium]